MSFLTAYARRGISTSLRILINIEVFITVDPGGTLAAAAHGTLGACVLVFPTLPR
jgi:hypothetical protein